MSEATLRVCFTALLYTQGGFRISFNISNMGLMYNRAAFNPDICRGHKNEEVRDRM